MGFEEHVVTQKKWHMSYSWQITLRLGLSKPPCAYIKPNFFYLFLCLLMLMLMPMLMLMLLLLLMLLLMLQLLLLPHRKALL